MNSKLLLLFIVTVYGKSTRQDRYPENVPVSGQPNNDYQRVFAAPPVLKAAEEYPQIQHHKAFRNPGVEKLEKNQEVGKTESTRRSKYSDLISDHGMETNEKALHERPALEEEEPSGFNRRQLPNSASRELLAEAIESEDDLRRHKKLCDHPTQNPKFKNSASSEKPSHSPESAFESQHHSTFPEERKDVEMILPHDKVLLLPSVNGRPKPYDGYRALPELEHYKSTKDKVFENSEQRERRLSQGAIVNGQPKMALSPFQLYESRFPAEYKGGIQPHYDFTDSKLSTTVDSNAPLERKENSQRLHKAHTNEFPNSRKRPTKEKREYSSGYVSEEDWMSSSEEENDGALGNYESEQNFSSLFDDFEPEEHFENESLEEDDDEYYGEEDDYYSSSNRHLKTLSASESSESESSEPTENQSLKNCQKEETRGNSKTDTQVCYLCTDEKTGNRYEQCFKQNVTTTNDDGKTHSLSDQSSRRIRRSVDDESSYVSKQNIEKKESLNANGNGKENHRRPRREEKQASNKTSRSVSYSSSPHTYGGKSTFSMRDENFGVPASIYEDAFDSSEESNEEFRQHYSGEDFYGADEEESESHKYYKSISGSRSHDQYFDEEPKQRHMLSYSHSKSSRYSEANHRSHSPPKKNSRYFSERLTEDEEFAKVKSPVSEPQIFPEFDFKTLANKQPNSHFEVHENKNMCQRRKKGEMTCLVCKNEKTGSTSEHCQFRSATNNKLSTREGYYRSQRLKSSDDNSGRDQRPEKSEPVESGLPMASDTRQQKHGETKASDSLFPRLFPRLTGMKI